MNIEAAFKADISGWLEYSTHLSTPHSKAQPTPHSQHRDIDHQNKSAISSPPDLLIQSLNMTLSYFDHSPEALEALHRVLFYQVVHRFDSETDFDVVNYKMGIDHGILHYVAEHFEIHKYTCYELWKMPERDALQFIVDTYDCTLQPLAYFDFAFIKIVSKVDMTNDAILAKKINEWLPVQIVESMEQDSKAFCRFLRILEIFYDCLSELELFSMRQNERLEHRQAKLTALMTRLIEESARRFDAQEMLKIPSYIILRTFNGSFMDVPFQKAKEEDVNFKKFTNMLTCEGVRTSHCSVEEDWHYLLAQPARLTSHEKAFFVIGWHLRNSSLTTSVLPAFDVQEKAGFDRLKSIIEFNMDREPSDAQGRELGEIKLWCIFSLQSRSGFWLSVLKYVVQFLDLWISELKAAECADILAKLVAENDMLPLVYTIILKHVQRYYSSRNEQDFSMVKHLVSFLEQCMDSVKQTRTLMRFRDYVLLQLKSEGDVCLPTFGTCTMWNIPFEQELTRVSNRITTSDDDSTENMVPDEQVVRQLVKLSVVWPYQVLRILFSSCVPNKNHFKAVVPILQQLGGLCTFRATDTSPTLLLQAIDDVLVHFDQSSYYLENIAQFFKYCLSNELQPKYPIIAMPNSAVDQLCSVISLGDLLVHFGLKHLKVFSEQRMRMVRLVLYVLNSLCDPPPNSLFAWTHVSLNAADLPAVLYCSPETYAKCLTELVALRERNTEGFVRLQDWEAALKYVEKFTLLAKATVTPPLLDQFLQALPGNYGWTSQLPWYPLIAHRTLQIPSALYQITGGLNGLFSVSKNEQDEKTGWQQLFHACKMSTDLTDALFQHQSQWQYNLVLLWRHPSENEIMLLGFREVLHPSTGASVSLEYSHLVYHFLLRLCETFECHSVIQSHSDEPALTQELTHEEGIRLYYIVSSIIQLLKDQAAHPVNELQDNYYASQLIKVLQHLTNWGDISKDGRADSYQVLKAKISSMTETTVYYPLSNTEKLRSDRALSILAVYHLLQLIQSVNQTQAEVIQRAIMHVAEGLVDMHSRHQFERMLQQQPSKRIATWKKKSRLPDSHCKTMQMRPILSIEERELLQSVASLDLLQAVGLVVDESSSGDVLYFF